MHIAIVGNGIAGISAALRIRKQHPDWRISIISGESKFHYSRPALMYIFMGHMPYKSCKPYPDEFWAEQRLDLVRGWVTEVDTDGHQLRMHNGEPISYDRLLLATGSKSNRFGWPGQDLDGVQSLYDLRDLKLLYDNTQGATHAVLTGGGLIGIELAEMLHTRGIHVTFIVREDAYWDNILPSEEARMINGVIRAKGIDLKLQTHLAQIVDDGNGRACAVITDKDERLDCQLVGLTAGVTPNVDLVSDSPIETGRGILVDRSLRTNIDDIFAAGDCAEIKTEGEARNLIQQVWYTGQMQGEHVGDVIAGNDGEYHPGIWYNSAKFFDLEYQTYGSVNLSIPGEQNIYWEHPDRLHAVRIVHADGAVIGFNFMGIRARHRVCEAWIREKLSPEAVLDRLDEAHFDPEFFTRHEQAIRGSLRSQLLGQGATA